ncbi:MAG: hypothetical protein J6C07_04035 [Lachnospiraceae bacterium]|nr:hypothetical protein [Lachnospiraceae bacterium]
MSTESQTILKSAAALFAQLQITLHHPLHISFFSGTSNKWLTRREPSSGKAPPPLEPAEKVLNVKVRKSCGKKNSPSVHSHQGNFPIYEALAQTIVYVAISFLTHIPIYAISRPFLEPCSGLSRRLRVFLQEGYACPLGFSNLFEEEGNNL